MRKAVFLGLLLQIAGGLYASDVEQVDQNLSFALEFGTVELQSVSMNGSEWQILDCEQETLPGAAGAPALPRITRLIEIPPTGSFAVEYTQGAEDVIHGVRLLPEQQRVQDSRSGGPLEFAIDEDLYSSDAFWPAQTVQIGDPVILRNRRMLKLSWSPCQWNPQSGELLVTHDIQIVLHHEEQRGRNELTRRIHPQHGPCNRMADAALDFPLAQQDAGALRDIFERPILPGTYLLIGHSGALENALMQEFIEWKRSRGHIVVVESEEEIGSLTPNNIRNTISDHYFDDEYPPDFVMLIGDPDGSGDFAMPASDSNYDGYQDHGFALVDGDDILGDLAIGRISVSSQAQLASVLTKIMSYERFPTAAGGDWLSHAALSTGYHAVSMVHLSRSIAQRFIDAGYNDIDSLWYNSNATWVNARFNEGISQYCYRGWIGMNGVDASYIDNNSSFNNSNRCPIACIFTCATGDYNGGYSTTEAFLRKGSIDNPRGAVAAMGFSTAATHTAYNNAIVAGYYSGIHDLQLPIGPAMFRGKYNLWATLPEGDSNAQAFSNRANLMGDPGLEDWNGLPQHLELSCVEGDTLPYGQSLVTFEIEGEIGQAIAGAAVCVYQAGNLQERALSGPDGIVRLSLAGAELGSITATVSKRNCIPQQIALELVEAESMLVLTGSTPDGLVPGVSGDVSPLLRNGGSVSLSEIELYFSTQGDTYTLTDSLSTVSDLDPAEDGTGDLIRLTPLATLADYSLLRIPVRIETSAGSREDILELRTTAPQLEVMEVLFNDIELLTPGEGIVMQLNIANTGHLEAQGLQLELSCADPAVTLTSQPTGPQTLAVGADEVYSAVFDLPATVFDGAPIPFTCSWTTSNGPAGSIELPFYVGVPQAMAPSGPDAYGYYAYEDMDNNTKSPVYEWQDIAIGSNELPIFDTADEDDDAMRVDLPFDFVYYGQTYSDVAVCTNGYIAFGEGAENDPHYRNHRLPSATGPNGMVAPFWDDMITSGGGVYAEYDAGRHCFTLQWDNLTFNGNSSSRNTFQVILLDPAYHTTATGDGDIVMQWQTWNNDQSNSYDFPYCSVGIESPDNLTGISISNFNLESNTIFGMYAQKAICFSTDRGERMINETNPPIVQFHPLGMVREGDPILYHCVAFDPSGVGEVSLHLLEDGGDTASAMQWDTLHQRYQVELPARELGDDFAVYVEAVDQASTPNHAFTDTTEVVVSVGFPPSGPDDYGHLAAEALDAGGAAYDWVDISDFGVALDFGFDYYSNVETAPLNLTWFGDDFDAICVTVSGACFFGAQTPDWVEPVPMATGDGAPNQINIFSTWYYWMDDPQIYCWVDELGGRVIITYENMAGWTPDGEFFSADFQAILYDADQHETTNGDSAILFQYQLIESTAEISVGFQDATRQRGLNLMYNGEYIDNLSEIASGTSLLISSGWVTSTPEIVMPQQFRIERVWPNPFNPSARVRFALPQAGNVQLGLYNLLGQEVSRMLSGQMAAGEHDILLDGKGLASGVYLLRLASGEQQDVQRVILLR